jgi:hypothetical protein
MRTCSKQSGALKLELLVTVWDQSGAMVLMDMISFLF